MSNHEGLKDSGCGLGVRQGIMAGARVHSDALGDGSNLLLLLILLLRQFCTLPNGDQRVVNYQSMAMRKNMQRLH